MYSLAVGGRRGCSGGGWSVSNLRCRIDPTSVHTRRERFGRFRVELALPYHATERGLDMVRRTAEPVIELHVPEGCIEIVTEEEPDGSSPKPDAFRLTSRSDQGLGRLRELVNLLGAFSLGRWRALATGFGLLGNGETGRQKQGRYANCVSDPTDAGETHGCFDCWATIGRLIPLGAGRFGRHLRLVAIAARRRGSLPRFARRRCWQILQRS